ncbi:MAG: RluA family pseudouridine synthase [Lachnospiraceae bacterium]
MERILQYFISKEYENVTLRQYLTDHSYAPGIQKILRGDIRYAKINGIPSYLTTRLQENDRVEIIIPEQTEASAILPVPLSFDIVYEDEDLIVINKPANMPIHPSIHNYDNTLANALADYYKDAPSPFVFRCLMRLDRDTSGLTIVAKNRLSASILSGQMMRREIQKNYLAITSGYVEPKQGTVNAPIARKEESCIERCVDFEKGEEAITHYRVLQHFTKNNHAYSLISLSLETGRTHQIRVHMKHLGYPLIGDFLYFPEDTTMKRQALHVHSISFSHPINGNRLSFEVPLPEDMQNLLPKQK